MVQNMAEVAVSVYERKKACLCLLCQVRNADAKSIWDSICSCKILVDVILRVLPGFPVMGIWIGQCWPQPDSVLIRSCADGHHTPHLFACASTTAQVYHRKCPFLPVANGSNGVFKTLTGISNAAAYDDAGLRHKLPLRSAHMPPTAMRTVAHEQKPPRTSSIVQKNVLSG